MKSRQRFCEHWSKALVQGDPTANATFGVVDKFITKAEVGVLANLCLRPSEDTATEESSSVLSRALEMSDGDGLVQDIVRRITQYAWNNHRTDLNSLHAKPSLKTSQNDYGRSLHRDGYRVCDCIEGGNVPHWRPVTGFPPTYTALIYLSAHRREFVGGIVSFPVQKRSVSPAYGRLLFFHSNHMHEVSCVRRTNKHMFRQHLQVLFCSGQQVLPSVHPWKAL